MSLDKQKLIPDNIGGSENFYDDLPIVGTVEFMDGLIATIPVLGFMILSGSLIPDGQSQIRLVFIGIGASISIIALLVKPNYLTLNEFISIHREYRSKEKELDKDLSKTVETVKVNEDPDTRNKIGINRIYPNYNVVEREDESMLSFIELSGVDIEVLGTQQEWRSHASALMNTLNGNVDEDIQIFMPMRQYDPTAQVSQLEERSNDPEIMDDDLLTWYSIDRINFHQAMAEEGFYRKFYVIIKTNKSEVLSENAYQQTGVVAALDNIPIPGLKEMYVNLRDMQFGILSPREVKNKQLSQANEKAANYAQIFGDKSGGQTRVLSGNEIGVLLKEFWEGRNIGEDQAEEYLRTQSYVMGPEELNRGDNDD